MLPIFLAHDARMVAGRDIKAEGVLVVDLHAIDADVDPTAFFRFAGNDAVGGADVAPAVELMPVRRREDRHVYVSAGFDVFENRTASDYPRRHRFYALEQLFPSAISSMGGHSAACRP